jgi:hypothetical protein
MQLRETLEDIADVMRQLEAVEKAEQNSNVTDM